MTGGCCFRGGIEAVLSREAYILLYIVRADEERYVTKIGAHAMSLLVNINTSSVSIQPM
jgi:hypothetical protein